MGRDWKLSVWASVGGGLAALILAGGFVSWRASRALHDSKQEVRAAKEIRLAVRPYLPPQNVNFEVVRSPEVFLQAARFQDHLYIAGSTGLSVYDLEGTPQRQFLAGRDLPSSPLVAISVGLLSGSAESELRCLLQKSSAVDARGLAPGRGHSICAGRSRKTCG